MSNEEKPVEICREYGLSPTMQNFLRDEKKVREEFEKNRDSKRQMIRKLPHYDLEQALIKWIRMAGDLKTASVSDT